MLEEKVEKTNPNVPCQDDGISKRESLDDGLTQECDISKIKVKEVEQIVNVCITKDLCKVVKIL